MNWDTVRVSLLTPFGYDWRRSHFSFDVTKVQLYFELQNYFPKNFSNLTLINGFEGLVTVSMANSPFSTYVSTLN
jgi:hypothetical protein